MKANELRIGNWYLPVGVLNIKEEPTQLTLNTMAQICHLPNGEVSNFEPIPLTEEWLMKFGFENIINDHYKLKYDDKEFDSYFEIVLIIPMEKEWPVQIYSFEDEDNIEDSSYLYICSIQYVHQLQNLYYALTGQEL